MGFAVVNVSCEVSASEGKEQIHGRGGRGGTVEVALETLPLGLGPHPVWGRRPPSLLSALPSVLGVNSWVTGQLCVSHVQDRADWGPRLCVLPALSARSLGFGALGVGGVSA